MSTWHEDLRDALLVIGGVLMVGAFASAIIGHHSAPFYLWVASIMSLFVAAEID